MRRVFFTLFFSLTCIFAIAGEGMWLPLLLKAMNEAEMQKMGMQMSVEDIYSVNEGSLKDAIVDFGGICTGEVVSQSGLLLTNHHCGYDNIQQLSTLENNLLRNGYWAENQAAELPCPGLFVTFIIRIEDVTEKVLAGVTDSMLPEARQSAIDKNTNVVIDYIERKPYQSAFVRPFYHGNQYYAFVTETYNDVRLVGTPPESIGKFGADTDNWEWPRHTGDFSLFRIYAGQDNMPANYSEENVPFQPKHHLPVSIDGVDEGDFALVFGFPGRTDQYLPSYGVEYIAETVDPTRIAVRDRSLEIMDNHMREDEEIRLYYAPRFASIANGWKKWIGEIQGLEQTKAIEQIRNSENEFMDKVQADPALDEKYGDLLPTFETLYADLAPYAHARVMYSEIINRNIDLFQNTIRLFRTMIIYENNGEEAYRNYADRQIIYFRDYFSKYRTEIDREICHSLMSLLINSLDRRFLPDELINEELFARGTSLDSLIDGLYQPEVSTFASVEELLLKDGKSFRESVMELNAVQLLIAIERQTAAEVNPHYDKMTRQINELKREYMQALIEVFPDRRFWPDANSTMRVSYGLIEGYEPRDAIQYLPVTYLEGVIEKYVPGDYEFDVPDKLLALFDQKDYGQYADKDNGKLPVCVIGSIHTSGGNSGSPAIDAHGNLIGINFDRVWEGTMSDYYYDRSICRNIMVDIRYVLFIIDKFAGADHLIDEMTLVRPKSG